MKRLLGLAVVAVLLGMACPLYAELVLAGGPPEGPAKWIKGKVVDARGKPVRNAEVFLLGYSYTSEGVSLIKKLKVDRSGSFSCQEPKTDYMTTVMVTATAPGMCYANCYGETKNGLRILRLYPEWKLQGIVTDQNGKAISGARVKLSALYGKSKAEPRMIITGGLPGLDVVTGANGRFSVGKLPNPSPMTQVTARLQFAANGRADQRRNLAKKDLTNALKIALAPEAVVKGTLLLPDKAGPAPAGTALTLSFGAHSANEPRVAKTDSAGRFHFSGLPAADATLVLGDESRGYRYTFDEKPTQTRPWVLAAVTDIKLTPGDVRELELVLSKGALIRGKAFDKATGKPLEEESLYIFDAGKTSGGYGRVIQTTETGEFSARVAAGEVTIASMYGSYPFRDEPTGTTLTITDGEDKAGLEVQVDQSDPSDAMEKPIPDDFRLVPGTYELEWDPDLDCSDVTGFAECFKGPGAAAKIKAKPIFKSKQPKFTAFRLDGKGNAGLLVAAMDESRGTGQGFDTLYADLNRNLDLTDDAPVMLRTSGDGDGDCEYFEVDSRQLFANGAEARHPVKVRLNLCKHDTWSHIIASRKGGWKASIETSKGDVDCALIDSNCDGVYGQSGSGAVDSIFLDTNGYGKVLIRDDVPHQVKLWPVQKVGPSFYRITAGETVGSIRIEPYSGDAGSVTVRGNIQGAKAVASEITLSGPQGKWECSSVEGKTGGLPAGKATLVACQLDVECGQADPVTVNLELARPVKIMKDGDEAIEIQGKLVGAIGPVGESLRMKSGASQPIDWAVKLGSNVTVTSLGEGGKAPTLQFVNKAGKVVATKTSAYG